MLNCGIDVRQLLKLLTNKYFTSKHVHTYASILEIFLDL